jgi:hypothetical protein
MERRRRGNQNTCLTMCRADSAQKTIGHIPRLMDSIFGRKLF